MLNQTAGPLSPVLYIPHGGGPLPVLGDKNHEGLVDFLQGIVSELGEPEAILVISAHWEEDQPTLTSASHPELIYDYYGFPEEAYEITYPAPGAPQLAKEILEVIRASGISAGLDANRGYDHGLFIPLKLMYPQAQIPCVQLSLMKNLDPLAHIALGKAIAAIRKKNVLTIGSGLSFHNLRDFFSPKPEAKRASEEFDNWLVETCTSQDLSSEEREKRLIGWESAPSARYCHPREEHLLPLHVCYGMASAETPTAKVVYNQELFGKMVSSFLW